ncbi:TPA: DNA-directed RNA polymerase subunit K [Candidatus Micrarchaeota archaeon]|nr:DNA-directed RNA polymerase subunit K [Candidatus Micrarchaeota archaeon]
MIELTKYELARIIGARALQLSCGAPPLIKVADRSASFIEVAQLEFDKNVMPLSVVRKEDTSP